MVLSFAISASVTLLITISYAFELTDATYNGASATIVAKRAHHDELQACYH